MNHYIYAYCNVGSIPVNTPFGMLPGIPFYIGQGMNDRMFAHLKEVSKPPKKPNHQKIAVIKRHIDKGLMPIIVKLIDGLTKAEANLAEIELIAFFGTKIKIDGVKKRGPLTNLHRGGIGGTIKRSEESNRAISKKLKGRDCTWGDKISSTRKSLNIKLSEEHRAALHSGGKNRIRSVEENAKRGAAISAASTSEITAKREATRRKNHKGWYSQEALKHRAELVASGALKHTEETKRQIAESTRIAMQDEKIREKMRASAAKRWSDPAEAEKIRERNSKTYELVHRETGKRIIVKNLSAWCQQNGTYHRKVQKEYIVKIIERKP